MMNFHFKKEERFYEGTLNAALVVFDADRSVRNAGCSDGPG